MKVKRIKKEVFMIKHHNITNQWSNMIKNKIQIKLQKKIESKE